MIFQQVNELRKAGELRQAHDLAAAELEQRPDDPWAAKAMYWVLRDMAMQADEEGRTDEAALMVDEMATLLPRFDDADGVAAKSLAALRERKGWEIYRHLKENMEQLSSHDIRQALVDYLLQPVERPSRLHSLMLGQAVKAAKMHEDFNFAEFMTRWGTDCFTDADWERHRGKQNLEFPSLVERALTRYIAAARRHRVAWTPEFMSLLERAMERFPDKDQLRRHYALALHQQGRTPEAMEIYRRLLLTLNTFYAWHELAHLTTDTVLSRAALCRAVMAPGTAEFKVNLYLELGVLLAEEGCAAEALALLNAYRSARADKPLHELPGDWFIATSRIPEGTQPVADLRTALQPLAEPADDWLYAGLPPVPVVVQARYTNAQGKHLVRLVAPDGMRLIVPSQRVPRGTKFMLVRVTATEVEGRMKVVHQVVAPPERVLPAFADCTVTGPAVIRTNAQGKRFAFVEGVYVPGDLINGVANGQPLTVLVEATSDGRRRAMAVL